MGRRAEVAPGTRQRDERRRRGEASGSRAPEEARGGAPLPWMGAMRAEGTARRHRRGLGGEER
eukprot:scaffold2280_cov101-Isochrysis_galbana.AAC.2